MKHVAKNSATLRNKPFNKETKQKLPKGIKARSHAPQLTALAYQEYLDYDALESSDLDYIAKLSMTLDKESFYEL